MRFRLLIAAPLLALSAILAAPGTSTAQVAPNPRRTPPGNPAPGAAPTPAPQPPQPQTFAEAKAAFLAAVGKPYIERVRTLSPFTRFKTRECVVFLDEVRRTDTDANIKRQTLNYIGQVGVDPARQILEGILDSPQSNASDKSGAFNALTYIKPPIPPDRFLAGLAGTDATLHQAAARALGNYPTEQVANALASALARISAPPAPGVAPTNASTASYLKRSIVDSLRRILPKEPVATWFVETALAKKSPFPAALGQLISLGASSKHPKLRDALAIHAKSKSAPARAATADVLGELDEGKRGEAADSLELLTRLLKDKDDAVIIAAGVAIGRIGPEGASLDAVLKLCKSGNPGLKAIGLGALGPTDDPRAIALAKKALTDRAFPARAAAVKALKKIGTKEAVTALVAGLKKNKTGRLQADIIRALEELTGAQPGPDWKAWDGWWSVVVADFELPDRSAGDAPEAGPRKPVSTQVDAPTYYGSEVVSKRVAFIVDVSGSMSARVPREGEEVQPGQQPTGPTRLEVCQEELRKVVGALGKGAYFNLVSFHTTHQLWQQRITQIGEKSHASAMTFINALRPTGGTNIYDPLEAVLLDPEVDTIYLLSDGSPGSGKFVATDDICREIRKINTVRQVAIHTISIGADSQLMKRLADENGGDAIVHK